MYKLRITLKMNVESSSELLYYFLNELVHFTESDTDEMDKVYDNTTILIDGEYVDTEVFMKEFEDKYKNKRVVFNNTGDVNMRLDMLGIEKECRCIAFIDSAETFFTYDIQVYGKMKPEYEYNPLADMLDDKPKHYATPTKL